MEEMTEADKSISHDRVQNRTVEQIVGFAARKIQDELTALFKDIHQEHMQQLTPRHLPAGQTAQKTN